MDVRAALEMFPSLPDEARIRVPVVAALKGRSLATIYREAKTNPLLKITQHSPGLSTMRVGDVRKDLRGKA